MRSHSLVRQACRLSRDRRGVSAVEFALILPFMILLFLGGVEVSQAITVKRKVTLTASSIADLVARDDAITDEEMTNIFDAAGAVMTPYPDEPMSMVVSSVSIGPNGRATVDWSEARNGTPRVADSDVTVPDSLLLPDTSLIMAEIAYVHEPMLGYVLTGDLNMTNTFHLRPRKSESVAGPE